MSIPSTPNNLLSKEELLLRLEEVEETLRAIRSGEVDALVVSGVQGDQVFTLRDAALPYQVLIEEMNEGALTLSLQGTILYCNSSFAEILGFPMEKILGESFHSRRSSHSQGTPGAEAGREAPRRIDTARQPDGSPSRDLLDRNHAGWRVAARRGGIRPY
jgi:PAS domain-containing protein